MVVTKRLRLQTKGHGDVIDITSQVEKEITTSEVSNGVATIFIVGSTAGITTLETETGLIADFQSMWERIIPKDISYHHDRAWGEGNGYAHVRASFLGASLSIPLVNKALTLGTWQQIILIDFDNRPRSREIILQIIGD